MGGRGASSSLSGAKSTGAIGELKIGDTAVVDDWFKFDLPNYAMQPKKVTIVGESTSGKAWKVDIETESKSGEHDLYFTRYAPKKALISQQESTNRIKQAQDRIDTGKQKYNDMVDFAKSKGIKGVRVGLKKDTILKKIKEAGYSYNY